MPWKSVMPVHERMRFITLIQSEEGSFAELCRQFGISRKTGYKWVSRFESEGPGGLVARPSVAVVNGQSLSAELEAAIVLVRKTYPTWGPKKVRAHLLELEPAMPAVSTVAAVLKRNGLIKPRRRRLQLSRSWSTLTCGEQPNDVWCVDFKGDFLLKDKTRCYPLTVTDFFSRYLIACEGLRDTKAVNVRPIFERIFLEFGVPAFIRSDNGGPFSSIAIGGLSPLSVWWVKLGITPERTQPGHPEQNGRHERMHRTLKAEATKPAQENMPAQRATFDKFRHVYNDVRPHESLGLKSPSTQYSVSRRRMPNELADPVYPNSVQTRRLDPEGRLMFHHHRIKLSPLIANELVGLTETGEGINDIHFGPLKLGVLDSLSGTPTLTSGSSNERTVGRPRRPSALERNK